MTDRLAIGLWTEHRPEWRWTNEGMSRLLGFLMEGAAISGRVVFRLVVPDWLRAEVEADVATLRGTRGVDFTVHSPCDVHHGRADHGSIDYERAMRALVDFANAHVPVEGWISMFPRFQRVLDLKQPSATILPDAIPVVFPDSNPGLWTDDGLGWLWYRTTRDTLSRVDRVITFSRHVARDQAQTLFGVGSERIVVAPHAPPDLSGLLPFVRERQATAETRRAAAAMLRSHARARGWRYLQDFAFEEACFVVVSTQDRVTKNIGRAADAVRRVLQRDRVGVKLFTTATLLFGADWTLLPQLIEREQMHRDVISVPDLPRDVHAALYHCAAASVHPSFFEGGLGPFPFYEAVSVGTPCLMARGPHVEELLAEEPGLSPDTFDPYDVEGLASLLRSLLGGGREEVLARQSAAYERLHRRRNWGHVAEEYAVAAVGRRLRPAADAAD